MYKGNSLVDSRFDEDRFEEEEEGKDEKLARLEDLQLEMEMEEERERKDDGKRKMSSMR